jgi:hypothetical protein
MAAGGLAPGQAAAAAANSQLARLLGSIGGLGGSNLPGGQAADISSHLGEVGLGHPLLGQVRTVTVRCCSRWRAAQEGGRPVGEGAGCAPPCC